MCLNSDADDKPDLRQTMTPARQHYVRCKSSLARSGSLDVDVEWGGASVEDHLWDKDHCR
jgi:hypothetical protein